MTKNLFCLVPCVTALYDLWSPDEWTLIGTGCQLTTGSITTINKTKGFELTYVLKKTWRQQFCVCDRGKRSKQILQVCIRAISLQRVLQPWLLLICHQSNPNNSCTSLQGNEWVVRRRNDKHKESNVKFNQKNWNLWVKILDIDYFCCCPGTEKEAWGIKRGPQTFCFSRVYKERCEERRQEN